MKAEIITSGTELLLGEITDTNTPYIAGQLAALGINLYYTSTVGDNFQRYSEILRRAWERSDLIITTGGLGPTQGDITREVIAALLGEEMVVVEELKQELTEFFARLKLELTENNFKQTTLIPSASALRNMAGTAPGWWVEKDGRIILALPGPPREMQSMWQHAVLPKLSQRCNSIILSRTLKTWGLSESKVDEMMSPFLSSSNPTLAMYAKFDGIHLRVTARAASKDEAASLIEGREKEIRDILGGQIWGTDDESLESVLGRTLASRRLTLAAAESFTGGLLMQTLSSIPEPPGTFRGGLYIPPRARESWGLGGPGPENTVRMASLAREKFGAEVGLAIDVSESDEADNQGQRQVFIAVDDRGRTDEISPGYPGRPDQAVRRTINHALMYLKGFVERD